MSGISTATESRRDGVSAAGVEVKMAGRKKRVPRDRERCPSRGREIALDTHAPRRRIVDESLAEDVDEVGEVGVASNDIGRRGSLGEPGSDVKVGDEGAEACRKLTGMLKRPKLTRWLPCLS
jgi:hypothetical protein